MWVLLASFFCIVAGLFVLATQITANRKKQRDSRRRELASQRNTIVKKKVEPKFINTNTPTASNSSLSNRYHGGTFSNPTPRGSGMFASPLVHNHHFNVRPSFVRNDAYSGSPSASNSIGFASVAATKNINVQSDLNSVAREYPSSPLTHKTQITSTPFNTRVSTQIQAFSTPSIQKDIVANNILHHENLINQNGHSVTPAINNTQQQQAPQPIRIVLREQGTQSSYPERDRPMEIDSEIQPSSRKRLHISSDKGYQRVDLAASRKDVIDKSNGRSMKRRKDENGERVDLSESDVHDGKVQTKRKPTRNSTKKKVSRVKKQPTIMKRGVGIAFDDDEKDGWVTPNWLGSQPPPTKKSKPTKEAVATKETEATDKAEPKSHRGRVRMNRPGLVTPRSIREARIAQSPKSLVKLPMEDHDIDLKVVEAMKNASGSNVESAAVSSVSIINPFSKVAETFETSSLISKPLESDLAKSIIVKVDEPTETVDSKDFAPTKKKPILASEPSSEKAKPPFSFDSLPLSKPDEKVKNDPPKPPTFSFGAGKTQETSTPAPLISENTTKTPATIAEKVAVSATPAFSFSGTPLKPESTKTTPTKTTSAEPSAAVSFSFGSKTVENPQDLGSESSSNPFKTPGTITSAPLSFGASKPADPKESNLATGFNLPSTPANTTPKTTLGAEKPVSVSSTPATSLASTAAPAFSFGSASTPFTATVSASTAPASAASTTSAPINASGSGNGPTTFQFGAVKNSDSNSQNSTFKTTFSNPSSPKQTPAAPISTSSTTQSFGASVTSASTNSGSGSIASTSNTSAFSFGSAAVAPPSTSTAFGQNTISFGSQTSASGFGSQPVTGENSTSMFGSAAAGQSNTPTFGSANQAGSGNQATTAFGGQSSSTTQALTFGGQQSLGVSFGSGGSAFGAPKQTSPPFSRNTSNPFGAGGATTTQTQQGSFGAGNTTGSAFTSNASTSATQGSFSFGQNAVSAPGGAFGQAPQQQQQQQQQSSPFAFGSSGANSGGFQFGNMSSGGSAPTFGAGGSLFSAGSTGDTSGKNGRRIAVPKTKTGTRRVRR